MKMTDEAKAARAAYSRALYAKRKNDPAYREYMRQKSRAYYKRNAERIKARVAMYNKEHPERVQQWKENQWLRVAAKMAAEADAQTKIDADK